MPRWILLSLSLLSLSVVLTASPAADPPGGDVGKWTDSQKLDDILDKMRALDTMRSELRMLEGSIKELLGLRDRIVMLEDKLKKFEADLNIVLNQVPANQTAVLEQLRKLKQDIDALRGGAVPPTGPSTSLKPNGPDPTVEQRLQDIEGALAQLSGQMNQLRRATPLPLPDRVTPKDGRIVRVVNRAPVAVTILIDDFPFQVAANSEGQFSPETDTFTYEVKNSERPRKTVNLARNERITLTLNWLE